MGGDPLIFSDPAGLEKWKWDGKGDTSICAYYDAMAEKNPKCGYYKKAADICRGKSDIVNVATNTAIAKAWLFNQTEKSQSEIYNSIRETLVDYDVQSRQTGHIDKNGCTCGDTIDFYHDQAFEEAGLNNYFYGGNLWPQNTWPNPVPYDPGPRGNWKDNLFN